MERYALNHIQTKDQRKNLVTVETSENATVRIRFVKQPPYIHQGTRYAHELFITTTDEGDTIEIAYEQDTHSCNVSTDMLQPVTRKEVADFLHYAIFTHFGKATNGKTDKAVRFEQMVLSEAIDTLYKAFES